jgi:hypothetical protein
MKLPLSLLLFVAPLAAQIVEGDVVNSATGAPVAGAHVSVNGMNGVDRVFAISDASGHFRIQAQVLYGAVMVVQPGFLIDQSAGLQPGQPSQPANLRIALIPQAVIAGKVEDEDGFPVEEAFVLALQYQIVEGQRELRSTLSPARTDDLGEFRLAGLSPGRYYLCVSPGNAANWDRRYSGECPSALDPGDAKPIEVSAGQEVNTAVVRMTRHAGVTVSGRVAPTDAAPTTRMRMVRLQPAERHRFAMGLTSTVQSDGSFAIRHVPPGSYSLLFNTGMSTPPRPGDLYAEQRIQVADSDLQGITLAPHEVQAANLSGKVIAEDGGAPPVLAIVLRGQQGPPVTGNSSEDGSFEFKGLLPGHYNVTITVPFSAMTAASFAARASSARLGGKEVLQSGFDLDGTPAGPLQVTVSARLAYVTGQLLDNAGQPVSGAAVMLLGTAGRVLMGTDFHGQFWTNSARPGDYRVYVLTDDSQIALLDDPAYLQAHQADLPPVHVAANDNRPLKVQLPAAR